MGVSGVQVSGGLDALIHHLPANWAAAVREVLQGAAATPTELDAWPALLHGLAWRPSGSGPVRPLGLTVKAAIAPST